MAAMICPICGNDTGFGDHSHPEAVKMAAENAAIEAELKPKFDRRAHMRKVALEYHARKRAAKEPG